ncbi:RNA polymerase sigma factor [Crenothrix sp.]|uniref:RNA polymerase sigma factor n=1 Tax=Crenothrix sp. TaxID=3100433 RepID=UPI00374D43D5
MNTYSSEHNQKDSDLINRICTGDENAFEQLYHHYYPRLFRFIGRTTWREDLNEEVINDVMYTVWEKAATYNHQCKLSTWIFGIAYNKTRQALRNQGHFDEDSLNAMEIEGDLFGEEDAELKQLETREWLDSILKILSSDQRVVIELTYFEGLHYSEIALLMDCPENTVKTRMHHARKILAVHLTNYKNASGLMN